MCGEADTFVISKETPVNDITWTLAFEDNSKSSESPVVREESKLSEFSWRLSDVEVMPFEIMLCYDIIVCDLWLVCKRFDNHFS